MGPYLEAFGKFQTFARGRWGGDAAAPNIRADSAASVLRYLKAREAMLNSASRLATRWETIGRAIAETPAVDMLDDDTRTRLWAWGKLVCTACDAENMAFVAVHPDPPRDHRLLQEAVGVDAKRDFTDDENIERDGAEPPASDLYVDPDAEATWGKSKPAPSKPPTAGDKFNTGLFLLAVIVVASVFHRR